MATVYSLLLGEDFRREIGGQITAIGLYYKAKFNSAAEARFKKVKIFATVTDLAPGDHLIDISVISYTDEKEFRPEAFTFTSKSVDDIMTFVLELGDFTFMSSGNYRYALNVNGEEAGFNVAQIVFDEPEPSQA